MTKKSIGFVLILVFWAAVSLALAQVVRFPPAATAASGSGLYCQTTVTLTDAQIKALPTTGIQIVAAPGANKMIDATHYYVHSSIVDPYTNIDAEADLVFYYESGFFIHAGIPNDSAESLTHLSDTLGLSLLVRVWRSESFAGAEPAYENLPNPVDDSSRNNKPITLQADNQGDGNFTDGNAANTLRVTALYTVLNLSTGEYEACP